MYMAPKIPNLAFFPYFSEVTGLGFFTALCAIIEANGELSVPILTSD